MIIVLINDKVLISVCGYSYYFCYERDLRLYVCVHEHSVVFFCAPHAGWYMLYNVAHRAVYPVFTLESIYQTCKHTDSHTQCGQSNAQVSQPKLQINSSRPVYIYSKPPKQSASTFHQLKQTNRVKNTVTL